MITSTLGRMATADKLSVQQLKQAVQDGTVPAYIGIPLIQEKMKQAQQATASQASQAPQQPPIADQILQQASGVPALPSNLPTQMAHGGIIHMAVGGYDPMSMARAFTRDDEDPEDMDYLNALGADEMPETQEPEGEPELQDMQSESGGISDLTPVSALAYAAPYATTRQADEVTVKREGEPAQTVRKETARVERPAAARDLERLALAEGEKYNLSPALIKHVMFKETGGIKDRANAVSPAGAMGVMQLMPGTARDLGVKDPYDPVQNIEGGVKYLAQMQRKYDDPKLAAIAYNWGPGRTDRWLAQGGDFSKLPKETQGYIKGLAGGGRPEDEFDEDTDDVVNTTGGRRSLKDIFSEGQDVAENAEDIYGTPLAQSNYVDPFGAPDYTTEDSGIKNIFKQKVEVGKPYKPGIGEITGYEVVPSTKGYDRAKSQGVGKPVPKNLPEPVPLKQEPEKAATSDIGGMRSLATEDSLREALEALKEPAKPVQEKAPAPAAPAAYDDLKEYFSKGLESLADQKKINAYLALLSGGLGAAGGTSPYPMTNIGQGAQAGVQTYQTGMKDIASQQAALMQGRLGLEKYQSLRDIQKQQMENLKAYRDAEEARKIESAKMRDITQNTAIQNRNVQAAQNIVQKMERDAVNGARAEVTQALKLPINMGKSQEEEQALYAKAEALALAQLNQRPYYRKLHHDLLTPGYDPGQLQVSPDISDLVNKYTQPKK